jgi:hypothetical protein
VAEVVVLFAGYYNNDVSSLTFNNGSGDPGFGQSVWNNVASSQFGQPGDKCSNPA